MPREPIDLQAIARTTRQQQNSRLCRIFVCASTGCLSGGGQEVLDALAEAARTHSLDEQIEIVPTGCMGLCSAGPLVRIERAGCEPVLFKEVTPLLARLILVEYVAPGLAGEAANQPVPDFLSRYVLDLDLPFFTKQERVVLANNGQIDPEQIEPYIARNGYRALQKVLTTMTPEEVIEAISASGLRGRGGAGFATGTKWTFGRRAPGEEKFIVCNGDEGDPGAYMDRSILEGDPHAVLEGMLIAAYAVGATEGWFYIRAEYPLAVARVGKTIRAARAKGLLGKNILGSDLNFTCEVRLGAGAFVCGEETALLHSIEGQRGVPRPRPPYPSQKGLWGRPTVINNVETLANVPPILRHGPAWYTRRGTADSPGTKVFALTGKCTYSGLIEVPMGMTLRDIVDSIAGGVDGGKALKGVQTGGPSGGVIPARMLDTPVSFEDLQATGSIMGSGGMIVLDEDDSMVDIAAFYLGFTVEESCGKCAPCRIGGTQMLRLLETIRRGEATYDDIDQLKRLAEAMTHASLCGLGQTAANPVVSTLRYFEDEYTENIIAWSNPDTGRGSTESPRWPGSEQEQA
jgi:NADH:ubiquinone oxidoreductase subunit F (NADH-binding)/(2Fe-2S) ferredoxin